MQAHKRPADNNLVKKAVLGTSIDTEAPRRAINTRLAVSSLDALRLEVRCDPKRGTLVVRAIAYDR